MKTQNRIWGGVLCAILWRNMLYRAETIEAFKKLYSERKDTIEYLAMFGNLFEKAQALLIKEVAAMDNVQSSHESLPRPRGYFGNSSSISYGAD